jgi:hypothetical protein
MWGRRPKHDALKITPFAPGGTLTFATLLCPGYFCVGIRTMSELLAIMDERAIAHPGARMLATLDDVGQACYTSGHTIDANELDPPPDDNAVLPDDAEVTPPLPDLAIRLERMVEAARSVSLDQLRNRLWWSGEGHPSFLPLHEQPDALVDRKETYIQAAPVAHAWEAVAAFPNGYFHGDLSPTENLVLARQLEETFGYALFGIGASYLGFRRSAPLPTDKLTALAAFIIDLHAQSNEPDLPTKIRNTLAETGLLFLRYVDR